MLDFVGGRISARGALFLPRWRKQETRIPLRSTGLQIRRRFIFRYLVFHTLHLRIEGTLTRLVACRTVPPKGCRLRNKIKFINEFLCHIGLRLVLSPISM